MRLETERLILRPWEDRDRPFYASYTADPIVRRFYHETLDRAQTDVIIDRMIAGLAENGYGFLVVERKSDGAMLGDLGLSPVRMPLNGNPPIEIGWLLGKSYWGQGYAPEGARAVLDYAFSVLHMPEVVAFTAQINTPSRRVMEKIGMHRDRNGDFDHPAVPEGHPVRGHVLYRIGRPD